MRFLKTSFHTRPHGAGTGTPYRQGLFGRAGARSQCQRLTVGALRAQRSGTDRRFGAERQRPRWSRVTSRRKAALSRAARTPVITSGVAMTPARVW